MEALNCKERVYGMIAYIAPELLNEFELPQYSKKTDIYSLGVLLWELSSDHPPFRDYNYSLVIEIVNGRREREIPGTPADYCRLYIDCWNGNPSERPIIKEVYARLKN